MKNIRWSELKQSTNRNNLKTEFANLIKNTSYDIAYESESSNIKNQISSEEKILLQKLNYIQNRNKKIIYKHDFFSLTLAEMGQEWSSNMINLRKDIIEMIHTGNFSLENMFLILNTDNRILFIGITLILISLYVYIFSIL